MILSAMLVRCDRTLFVFFTTLRFETWVPEGVDVEGVKLKCPLDSKRW